MTKNFRKNIKLNLLFKFFYTLTLKFDQKLDLDLEVQHTPEYEFYLVRIFPY